MVIDRSSTAPSSRMRSRREAGLDSATSLPERTADRLTGPAPRQRRRRRLMRYLMVLGPGLIAANAGNDAGGVVTYASAGAEFRYRVLFLMVLITLALIIVLVLA